MRPRKIDFRLLFYTSKNIDLKKKTFFNAYLLEKYQVDFHGVTFAFKNMIKSKFHWQCKKLTFMYIYIYIHIYIYTHTHIYIKSIFIIIKDRI